MLTVGITYHFGGSDYPLLKEASALYLSEIAPTHRLELLARWCGFNTSVSLRTALNNVCKSDIFLKLDPRAAQVFAADRGIPFDLSALHHTLASAAQAKIARETPDLHGHGYGRNSVYLLDNEHRDIRKSVAAAEVETVVFALREKKFTESRKELIAVRESDNFIRALAFCSALKPIKSINRKHSSYNLKHRAEERGYELVEGVMLHRSYVSNSLLIAAALYVGFVTDADKRINGRSSPNAFFNISQGSLNDVIERAPRE
jgi:hypothetical protein